MDGTKELELKPHELRMVQEKSDLDEKITKLVNFLPTELFINLDKLDRQLLTAQLAMMESYSKILGQRIDRFKNQY